jgi:hypothetical protein
VELGLEDGRLLKLAWDHVQWQDLLSVVSSLRVLLPHIKLRNGKQWESMGSFIVRNSQELSYNIQYT